jgi:hypothetical protein
MEWALNAPSWLIENTVVALLKKLPSWLATTTFAAIGIDIKDESIANATGIIMLAVAAKPELSIQILSQAIGLMMDGAIGIAEAVSFMFMVPVNTIRGGVSRYQKYRHGLRLQGEKAFEAEKNKKKINTRKNKLKQPDGTKTDTEQPTDIPVIESEKKKKKKTQRRLMKKNNNTRTRNQRRKRIITAEQ